MKPSLYFTILLLMLTGVTFSVSAQEQKNAKPTVMTEMQRQRQERNFYRKTLQVDSLKAAQVSQVQDSYKTALKAVIADTSLNEAAKRVKIKALMETKNQKLRGFLTPAQQEKIIPGTERMPAKATKQP
uniref:hypothetical protein n=1 Tax=Pedobacter schmidteae TaxID=2201271 RepID=UPI000EB00F20|nr:hypothetical protein [Pedobacter schmidteae]